MGDQGTEQKENAVIMIHDYLVVLGDYVAAKNMFPCILLFISVL